MGMKGCYACIKYLVVVFNLLFWLAGIGVLAVALWLYFDSSLYLHNTADNYTYFTAIFILMGAGAVMTIVGFLGCCGALQESPCLLGAFFVFLLVIFAAEVTGGVWAWLHKDKVKESITLEVTKMMKDYSKHDPARKTVDAMQYDLLCCGAKSPGDWSQTEFNNNNYGEKSTVELGISSSSSSSSTRWTFLVPTSCCKKDIVDCESARRLQITNEDFEGIHKDGCVTRLKQYFCEHLTVIIGIGIGVGIVQILGLIFSIVLCCAIRNEETGVYKA